MKNLLFFEAMLTPKIITFVYWLLLFAAVVGGFGSMFTFGRLSFSSLVTGLGIMVGGAIGVRIWCELLIVLFKINENMQKVANKS